MNVESLHESGMPLLLPVIQDDSSATLKPSARCNILLVFFLFFR